tara:strand:- start:7163 stop:7369 length:207 start_codon:yes stop_codon:yes gene_type:complete
MQNYVRELDQKGRATYRDKVKDLEGGQVAINKLYSEQLNKEKLEQRLANQIWAEVKPRMDKGQRQLIY